MNREIPTFPDVLDVNVQSTGVVTATLNRPEKLNAYNGELRYAICDLIDWVGKSKEVRVLVFTGAGRGFCSGADLTAEDARGWPRGRNDPEFIWCVNLLQLSVPTICAINGVAAGGGLGMALCCDFRYCDPEARLLPVWAKRAIHPDDLVTWTLPHLVGYSRALKWLYLGEEIPLDAAVSSGLIEPVDKTTTALAQAQALANRLAEGPTTQFALTKQAVIKALNASPWDSVTLESWGQDQARKTSDFKEGIRSFREKRPPQFKGS
ncbi:MAG: enoyl-CoA hydratase/isomerase family protein [Pseudomonadota bacterium]